MGGAGIAQAILGILGRFGTFLQGGDLIKSQGGAGQLQQLASMGQKKQQQNPSGDALNAILKIIKPFGVRGTGDINEIGGQAEMGGRFGLGPFSVGGGQ